MNLKRRYRAPVFLLQYAPADIPTLASAYMAAQRLGRTNVQLDRDMEDAGKRLVAGPISRRDAEIIYCWKSPRRMDLFSNNRTADVQQAIADSLKAKTARQTLAALTRLEGVGIKMASAFLTAFFPDRYTVLDVRALEALGLKNGESIQLYLFYLRARRRMARKYRVKLRNFDRANWQWSKLKSNQAKRCMTMRSVVLNIDPFARGLVA